MASAEDVWKLLGAAGAGVALVLALRWRKRSYATNMRDLAEREVCDHLRPAYELLLSRGHEPAWVGLNDADSPVEIQMAPPPGSPPFDPRQVYDELQLAAPVFVSERDVLYCKEDWCEIHPKRP